MKDLVLFPSSLPLGRKASMTCRISAPLNGNEKKLRIWKSPSKEVTCIRDQGSISIIAVEKIRSSGLLTRQALISIWRLDHSSASQVPPTSAPNGSSLSLTNQLNKAWFPKRLSSTNPSSHLTNLYPRAASTNSTTTWPALALSWHAGRKNRNPLT